MILRIIVAIFVLTLGSELHAQVQCGTQPNIPPDVQQRIQGDVEGKAQVFSKLLGDVNLKGKVDSSKNEVYQKYKDLDRAQIDQYMIWVSCQGIMSDQKLDTSEKVKLWLEIYRELTAKATQKSDAKLTVLASLPLGRSTIAYAESLLGIAREEGISYKVFEKAGYTIEVSYLPHNIGKTLKKGAVSAIRISQSSNYAEVRSDIAFLGHWNQKLCCEPLISPTATLGKTKLRDFSAKKGCRDFSWEPGQPLAGPIPVCTIATKSFESDSLANLGESTAMIDLYLDNSFYNWNNNKTVEELGDLYVYARQQYSNPPKVSSTISAQEATAFAQKYGFKYVLEGAGLSELTSRLHKELSSREVLAFRIRLAPGEALTPNYCPPQPCPPNSKAL